MFEDFIEKIRLDRIKSAYPQSLLSADTAEKREYFEGHTIVHKNLKMVTQDTWRYLKSATKQKVVEVIGPSGIGKTTLIKKLEATINEQEFDNMLEHPGYIPVISVEAGVPERGVFNWRENLYWEILKKLNPEFVTYYEEKTRRAPTTHQVSTAVRDAIIHRATKYIIIDEAQHLGIGAPDNERRTNNMDVLKSLANRTNCKMLLVGTYDLLKLLNLNGQLSRRGRIIHFQRYFPNIPADIKEFLEILVDFQTQLPVPEMPDFVSHAEELYEASLGCVGILKPILDEALGSTLDEESKTVTMEHVRYHFHSQKQLLRMMRDIKDGEKKLQESDRDHETLRALMGLNEEIELTPDSNLGTANNTKPRKKRGPKPGQRSPKRDVVGHGETEYVVR